MAQKTRSVDMTQGTIWKHLVAFALPMLIGQLFQQLYSTVDSVVVGQYVGKEALAAVGSTGNFINAIIGFFNGMSAGVGVLISQYFGARDEKGVHETVHTAILLTLMMAVVCTAGGILITDTALRWMATPDDVFGEASTYLRIYFAGVSGLMMYNMGSGILRAVGDSKRPLYFLIFSAVTNVALDLLFVCNFNMGVAGVAWATIISQFLSAILTIIVLCRSTECYRFIPSKMRLHKRVLRPVIRLSLPTGAANGIVALSNVFVQAYINAFQSDCMAGWTGYSRLDAFAWLPMMCIGMASTTFVGQNLGAGNPERSKKGIRTALLLSLAGTAVIVALLMIFADSALSLFNGDPNVLRYGRMFVLFCSPFYIPYCFTQICSGALRGAGDSVRPMVISILSFVVFRQIYLFIGTKFIDSPLFVGSAFPAGWIVSSTAMYIAYKKSDWEHNYKKNIAGRPQQ